ncbi:GxxExxY protein [Brumimicrobium aurantiacum]|uniref:GxxExxY protein n=1 Tax=Brumimicrobium aurantiacum TaxID=1737063 RepID=A0A3E1EXU8_9FLAO|nr:GxxExxY protein [Brumimicrobium aurantiacum]RFC54379.1 GxxExxY protein [Brumimicrobium aurantiacum]
MKENEISSIIIGCAIEVHNTLGPGLLESAYQQCLIYELEKVGLGVDKEVKMPIIYKEIKINQGYRIDLLVEKKVVVELKTVESLIDVHEAQLLTYLKLGKYKLGLLLNFKTKLMKHGIRRMVNNL